MGYHNGDIIMTNIYANVGKMGNLARSLLLYIANTRFYRKFASRFFHNSLDPKQIPKTRLSANSVNFCIFAETKGIRSVMDIEEKHRQMAQDMKGNQATRRNRNCKMDQQNTLLLSLESIACVVHVVRVPQGRGINDAAVFAYSKSLITKILPRYGDAGGEKRQSLKMNIASEPPRTDLPPLFIITRLLVISYSCFEVFHEQYRIELLRRKPRQCLEVSAEVRYC